jgi:23S rRNA (adenine2030-N6)-methyltransferase
MNYRHAFHAGNFADVHKHVGLAAALLHLQRKGKPFVVIDTHAGAGCYDLAGPEAGRTNESTEGIERIRALASDSAALTAYLEIVRGMGQGKYPGSPLIAAKLLRPRDRLIAVEKHPDEYAALAAVLKPYARARAAEADGFNRLPALLPPPERRGAILIDPPYETSDEFERLARVFAEAFRRFANGVYLLWFPMKLSAQILPLAGELQNAGATKLLLSMIDIGEAKHGDRLSAAGLFVVNPPFGFDAEMRAASAEILPHLSRSAGAHAKVEWLSPGR